MIQIGHNHCLIDAAFVKVQASVALPSPPSICFDHCLTYVAFQQAPTTLGLPRSPLSVSVRTQLDRETIKTVS